MGELPSKISEPLIPVFLGIKAVFIHKSAIRYWWDSNLSSHCLQCDARQAEYFNIWKQCSSRSRISLSRGHQLSKGCQHTILPNVPKNCMKLNKIWTRGGGGGMCAPLPRTMQCQTQYYLQAVITLLNYYFREIYVDLHTVWFMLLGLVIYLSENAFTLLIFLKKDL